MTFEERKSIIIGYIDADLSGSLPEAPGYIPGIGSTPTIKGMADDTFRLIVDYWDDEKTSDYWIERLGRIIKNKTRVE